MTVENERAYHYVVRRNAAIDRWRRQQTRPRVLARKWRRLLRAARAALVARKEVKDFEQAKEEFRRLAAELLSKQPARAATLKVVWRASFTGRPGNKDKAGKYRRRLLAAIDHGTYPALVRVLHWHDQKHRPHIDEARRRTPLDWAL